MTASATVRRPALCWADALLFLTISRRSAAEWTPGSPPSGSIPFRNIGDLKMRPPISVRWPLISHGVLTASDFALLSVVCKVLIAGSASNRGGSALLKRFEIANRSTRAVNRAPAILIISLRRCDVHDSKAKKRNSEGHFAHEIFPLDKSVKGDALRTRTVKNGVDLSLNFYAIGLSNSSRASILKMAADT